MPSQEEYLDNLLKGIETNYRLPLGQPEDETVANLQKEMITYGLL